MVSTSFPSILVVGTLISTSLQLDGCFTQEPSPESTTVVQEGGMWLPEQLAHPAHQDKLSELGFELPSSAFLDLGSYPMGAIANVGGCSASFVSKQGLLVTNHHCVQGLLPGLSQAGENLLKSGFIANTQEQERAAPGFSGRITLRSNDVTQLMLRDVKPLMDEETREALLDEQRSALISTCQSENPGLSCTISSFFDGNHYELQVAAPLHDLRLVYVPPEGLGWFGGDLDNWRWPRQTADFAFLRAYGPDGQPLEPPQHLRIASKHLAPSDPVMVAGYPARTLRYRSGAQVQFAQEHNYPYLVERFATQIRVTEELIAKDPRLESSLNPRRFALRNTHVNFQGILEGLDRSNFADERLMRDELLDQWINASPERALRFGSVLSELAALTAREVPNFAIDRDINLLAYHTIVLTRALDIVRQAKLRANGVTTTPTQVAQFVASFERLSSPSINVPGLEQAEIEAILFRIAKDRPEGERRVRSIIGLASTVALPADTIRDAVASWYATTALQELDAARDLFERATLAELRESEDGFVQAALAMDAVLDQIDVAKPSDANTVRRLRRLYTDARKQYAEQQNRLVAPDANGSLRISYGQIKGYRPIDQDFIYPPFSTGAELLAKHSGEHPFDLPQAVQDALKQRDFGRFFDPRLGDIPVNFLSTTDVSGGNSGSATMNHKGELVGLLFDGNYEGVVSQWYRDPEITRSIHLDMHFVLWVLDTVIPSHRLLREMGIEPRKTSVVAEHYEFNYAH